MRKHIYQVTISESGEYLDGTTQAAEQAHPQHPSGTVQVSLDSADGEVEDPGQLLIRLPFKVGLHHEDAVVLRKVLELVLEDLPQLESGSILGSFGRDFGAGPVVRSAALDGLVLHPDRDSKGHVAQPSPQHTAVPNPAGVLNELYERHLNRVFGILDSEDPSADVHDRRPMPRHERFEGRLGLIARSDQEPLDQLLIISNRRGVHQTESLCFGRARLSPPMARRLLLAAVEARRVARGVTLGEGASRTGPLPPGHLRNHQVMS
jgi:hypothetical protein